ncbi:MAG: glycosyltransferase family 39 protein, partial [Anaerolineae bacterium]|nr:glycosyltransferase family 39 protein [Anaerolineae bacterium]
IVIYLALGILYLFATPVLEAPDEIYHVAMINYVANTGGLPVQQVGLETDYKQEGSQPPLYYLITGFLTRWIDRSDYDTLRYFNPHANIGQAELMGNKNRIIHVDTSAQNMVYLARFFSLLCGAITVFAVYQSARQFAPNIKKLPLFATGLVIFNPQFLFMSTVANNDILVVMFNTVSLWLILLTIREGFDTRRSLILSVCIALGTISKLSGLVMVIIGAVTGLYVAFKRRDLRGLVILGVSMAGIWALLGGWWYLRNITLYDELFGTNMMLTLFGGRYFTSFGEWSQTLLGEFGGIRWSYWAVFGWFNIITWKWIYTVIDLVSLVALVGFFPFLWSIRRDKSLRESVAIAGLMLTIGTISFISWTTQTTGSQGRLLFPFIAPASIFLALGLMQVKIRPLYVLMPLIIFAVTQPLFIIAPSYAKPPIIESLPQNAVYSDVRFGDIQLVGYQLDTRRYQVGETIPITLYWRSLAPMDVDYTLAITAVLPDLSPIASINSFPGWGSISTTTWAQNQIYADTYQVRLVDDITATGDIRLLIRWWDYPDGDYLSPTTMDNILIGDMFIFAGGIHTAPTPALADMITIDDVIFGDTFRLVGYTLSDNRLSLLWEVVNPADDAYTVFAFALADGDNGREVMAQGDNIPPMSTQFYRVGEQFLTEHNLIAVENADAGTYPIYIGWYKDNRRLSVDAPDNMIQLT